MKYLFYVHGTPKGQSIWGNSDDDKEYCKSFYSEKAEEKVRFVIDIVPRTNRTHFTYLHEKNFLSAEERPGAYFGMTLSIDGLYYCKDTLNLYKLFDQVYSKYILGPIVATKQDKEVYMISDFAEKTMQLAKTQRCFIDAFTESFVNTDDICKIDEKNLRHEKCTLQKYNLLDVDCLAFYASLFYNLKVYVSSEYPSKDDVLRHLAQQINPEKEKSKRMTEERDNLQTQLNSVSQECVDLNNKVISLNRSMQQLQSTLRDKEQRMADLEKRNQLLEKERTKKNIETIVGQIQPQLNALLRETTKIVPDQYDKVNRIAKCSTPSIWTWVTMGMSVVSLLMLIFIIVYLLCPHLFITVDKSVKLVDKTHIVSHSPQTTPQDTEISIIFDNTNVICKDSIYSVYVKNVPNGEKVEWKQDGFNIIKGDKFSKDIQVRATNNGRAVLSFYVQDKKIWTQEFIVQK